MPRPTPSPAHHLADEGPAAAVQPDLKQVDGELASSTSADLVPSGTVGTMLPSSFVHVWAAPTCCCSPWPSPSLARSVQPADQPGPEPPRSCTPNSRTVAAACQREVPLQRA